MPSYTQAVLYFTGEAMEEDSDDEDDDDAYDDDNDYDSEDDPDYKPSAGEGDKPDECKNQ